MGDNYCWMLYRDIPTHDTSANRMLNFLSFHLRIGLDRSTRWCPGQKQIFFHDILQQLFLRLHQKAFFKAIY